MVEDDAKTSETVALYLRHAGYEIAQAYDGGTALAQARTFEPDLVILDLMLPVMSGLEVCAKLREGGDIAVIMLTARTTEEDRLRGLDRGADDYVGKPFSPRELVARVKAVLRRRGPAISERLVCGDLVVDGDAQQAEFRDTVIPLTRTEFRLLHALCRRPGVVHSRDDLVSELFGHDYDGTERSIDVHVRNIRRKLAEAGAPGECIRSVFGVGYKLAIDA